MILKYKYLPFFELYSIDNLIILIVFSTESSAKSGQTFLFSNPGSVIHLNDESVFE